MPSDDMLIDYPRTKTSGARTWLSIAYISFLHQFRGWVFFLSNWTLDFMGLLVDTAMMYFLASYITGYGSVLGLGMDYPAYVITNMIIAQLVSTSFSAYYEAYSQGFWGGTFEILMATPNGVSAYIAGFSAWVHLKGLASFVVMALLARAVFGINLIGSPLRVISSLVLVTLIGMTGLGLISASMFTLLGAKRSEPISWLVRHLSQVVCGVYFPVTSLPTSLQRISFLLPQTHIYAIGRELLRADNMSLGLLRSSLYSLIAIGIPTLIAGGLLFRLSLKRAYSGALSSWS